jgi:hypothetical protein
MSANTRDMAVTPHDVFTVLLDPWAYPLWVVGTKRVRGVDDTWPAEGSRFYHAVGAGPAELKDSSRLLEIDVPRRMVLEVRFRPVGTAIVELDVEPAPNGCRVTLTEQPLRGPVDWLWGVPLNRLVGLRNAVSLGRLDGLVGVAARARGVARPAPAG